MSVNRISSTISVTDQHDVMDLIVQINEKLAFLIDVGPEEQRSMAKLGDSPEGLVWDQRNRAFTRKALEIAAQTPDFLPRFDIAEMRCDLELFEALQPMLLALTRLRELVDDTAVAAGNEAYAAALDVYRYAKANGSVAGLDNLIDDMGQRFAQKGSRGKAPGSAPTGAS